MRPTVQKVAVPPDSLSARALPIFHYADAYRLIVPAILRNIVVKLPAPGTPGGLDPQPTL